MLWARDLFNDCHFWIPLSLQRGANFGSTSHPQPPHAPSLASLPFEHPEAQNIRKIQCFVLSLTFLRARNLLSSGSSFGSCCWLFVVWSSCCTFHKSGVCLLNFLRPAYRWSEQRFTKARLLLLLSACLPVRSRGHIENQAPLGAKES